MNSIFKRYETRNELIQEITDWNGECDTSLDTVSLAEEVATLNSHWLDSEEAVSRAFEEWLKESDFFSFYSESDSVAIDEAYNNWTDSLCKDGLIHESQYSEYTYEG